MSLYTKFGDFGSTMLYGGAITTKHHPRVHAYGSVDELNAVLGVILTGELPPAWRERLVAIQHELFVLGSDLATPMEKQHAVQRIDAPRIARMEQWIDEAESEVKPLTYFILPGGSQAGALLHQARTICRRAERWICDLAQHEEINPQTIIYMNRLGDLLFAVARAVNHEEGVEEVRVGG